MNPGVAEFEKEVAAQPPETWYDIAKKEYLIQDEGGEWIPRNETSYKRVLKQHGLSSKVESGKTVSDQDEAILQAQQTRNVHFAGAVAGYQTGFHRIESTRVLVTSAPQIIEPSAGEWTTLKSLIEGLLGAEGGLQLPHFYGWIKVAYEALRAGQCRPGQALVMCGPHNCGKSLLQNVLTKVLGGRAAKPYQAMTGGTPFNSDLFGAEHLMVEDEQPSTDNRARRAFGLQIKNVTVNEIQRLHGKHRDALVLKPFWRLTVSLNDEDENIMVLPPMDDSIEDKLILLKARRVAMPMLSETIEQRNAFWGRLMADLPGFLAWLMNWEIPAEWRCQRFGVRHFHHPDILRVLETLAPEASLLTLIDSAFFPCPRPGTTVAVGPRNYVEMPAEEIGRLLTDQSSPCAFEARKLLSWRLACGTYLGRLATKRPDRVQQVRHADCRLWRITNPYRDAETVAGDAMTASLPDSAVIGASMTP